MSWADVNMDSDTFIEKKDSTNPAKIKELARMGWHPSNLQLTKKAFFGSRIKVAKCYSCSAMLGWKQVVMTRAFKWKEMPYLDVQEGEEPVRMFNLICLCAKCVEKPENAPVAPKNVQEAIAFLYDRTEEGKQLKIEYEEIMNLKNTRSNDLASKASEIDKIQQKVDAANEDISYMNSHLNELEKKLQTSVSSYEEKKCKLLEQIENIADDTKALEARHIEAKAKRDKIKADLDAELAAVQEANRSRTQNVVANLEMVSETCENLNLQFRKNIGTQMDSIRKRQNEMREAFVLMQRDLKKEFEATLESMERTVSTTQNTIGSSLNEFTDEAEELIGQASGEKPCAVCQEPIRMYMMLRPCKHVFGSCCSGKFEGRCPSCREQIKDFEQIFFPI